MAERPTNAFFQRRRIGSLGEHVGIVVAFENQGITTGELGFDVRCDVTGIGKQAKPARAVGKHKLTGFARIVRDRIRVYGNSVDGKIFVAGEKPALREAVCFRRTECGVGSGREPDRQIVFTCQRADTINVVAVLMGHQDTVQFTGLTTETRETAFSFLQRKAAVHQDRRLPAFDQQPVATATAAEQGETQVAGAARP